jgi:hypothetical protein
MIELSIYLFCLLPHPAEFAPSNYLFFGHSPESPFCTDKAVQNWNVTIQVVFPQWHHGTGEVNVSAAKVHNCVKG